MRAICMLLIINTATINASNSDIINKNCYQEIFAHINDNKDTINLSLVCKNWYNIVMSDDYAYFLLNKNFKEDINILYHMAPIHKLKGRDIYDFITHKHAYINITTLTKEELINLIKDKTYYQNMYDYLSLLVKNKIINNNINHKDNNTTISLTYMHLLSSAFNTAVKAAERAAQDRAWIIDPQCKKMIWHEASFCVFEYAHNSDLATMKDMLSIIKSDNIIFPALDQKWLITISNNVLHALNKLNDNDGALIGIKAYDVAINSLLAFMSEEDFLEEALKHMTIYLII